MIQIKELQGKPIETGYYFAKEPNSKNWQLLVEIEGETPFLNILRKKILLEIKSDSYNNHINWVWSEKINLTYLPC